MGPVAAAVVVAVSGPKRGGRKSSARADWAWGEQGREWGGGQDAVRQDSARRDRRYVKEGELGSEVSNGDRQQSEGGIQKLSQGPFPERQTQQIYVRKERGVRDMNSRTRREFAARSFLKTPCRQII